MLLFSFNIDWICFFLLTKTGEFLNENGETIIDEEEYELIAKLQELKSAYRVDYDQWKNLKSEITYCQNLVNQCQNRLLQGKNNYFNLFIIILLI